MSQKLFQRPAFHLSQRQRIDLHILSLSHSELLSLLAGLPCGGPLPPQLAESPSPRGDLLHRLLLEGGADRSALEVLVGNLGPDGYLEESPDALAQRFAIPLFHLEKARAVFREWEGRGLACLNFREFFLRWIRQRPAKGLLRQAQILMERKVACLHFLPVLRLLRRSMAREDFLQILQAFADGRWPSHPNAGGLDLAGEDGRPGAVPELRLVPGRDEGGWRVLIPGSVRNRESLPRRLAAALDRRDTLLRRLGEWLAGHQEKFLLLGPEFLLPQTRRRLAEELALAPSTLSRALRHKFVQTPCGTWPLAELFSRNGEPPSTLLRSLLANLLREEPEALLWSDRRSAETLCRRHGFCLPRKRLAPLRRKKPARSSPGKTP
ncbi:MAG: hypothetical protein LBT98_02700 [Puniceicoccales bacterium]|jgi:DNA-directed RNA polymerase specialized sigma54-like protein|nr:hypothetical protein [Puniceicoccales bacterium]